MPGIALNFPNTKNIDNEKNIRYNQGQEERYKYIKDVFDTLIAHDIWQKYKIRRDYMIKIYGMDTCPDCTYLYDQIKGRENEFEYTDIGEHVKNLKEFLKIRDNSPVFDDCKANGYAGIPCFIRGDESVTIVPEDVGLKGRPVTGAACKLDGSGC